MLLPRVLFTAAVVALAYYIGREVGRTESIRDELERARRARASGEEAGPDTPARTAG
jgi:hypothetical protein